jgi:tetratricopeptide (TPR) repeat protein
MRGPTALAFAGGFMGFLNFVFEWPGAPRRKSSSLRCGRFQDFLRRGCTSKLLILVQLIGGKFASAHAASERELASGCTRRLRAVKAEAQPCAMAADGEPPAAKNAGYDAGFCGVGGFWLKRGRRENQPARPVSGLASLATLPLKDAAAWRRQGALYARAGRLAEAVECFEKALATAPKQDDQDARAETAATLKALAVVWRLLDNSDRAESGFHQALEIYEQLGRQSGVALACASLGELCERRGALGEARAWFKRSLSIDESRDYKTGMAANYGSLGELHLRRSDGDQKYLDCAGIMLQKALKLHEMLGAPAGVAANCGNLGVVYGARGDLARAEAMFRRSLAIEETLDIAENLASDWSNLGTVHRALGRLTQAEDMHRRALHYALQAEHVGRQATVHANLGDVLLARGEAAQARAHMRAAQVLFRQTQVAGAASFPSGLCRLHSERLSSTALETTQTR